MRLFIVCFLFLFVSTVQSQSETKSIIPHNPDGETMSIHLTPYWTDGSLSRITLESEFCFRAEVWLPVNENLTLRGFYDQTKTSDIKLNKTGFTLSYYFE